MGADKHKDVDVVGVWHGSVWTRVRQHVIYASSLATVDYRTLRGIIVCASFSVW